MKNNIRERIKELMQEHQLWIQNYPNGKQAVLIDEDLSGTNFRGMNLEWFSFINCNLKNCIFSECNLSNIYSSGSDFSGSDFQSADFQSAELLDCSIKNCNLSYCNMTSVNLYGSNLYKSNLSFANFSFANLSKCKLLGAEWLYNNLNQTNVSGVIGLQDPIHWMKSCFIFGEKGYIVYVSEKDLKNSGIITPMKENLEIVEILNPDPTTPDGSGVPFATKEWHVKNNVHKVWTALIKYRDAQIVVPFSPTGKARCKNLTLLREIEL